MSETTSSDLSRYYADGWGLAVPTLEYMRDILLTGTVRSILEFGSGQSTQFFIDMRQQHGFQYTIDSFDHDAAHAYQGPGHDFLRFRICPLIACTDFDYECMMRFRDFKREQFGIVHGPVDPFIRNATYDIPFDSLRDRYDLVLLDGPHGNGRSLASLYMQGRLSAGAHIVVDDYHHYDFVPRIRHFFTSEVVSEAIMPEYGEKGIAY